MTERVLHKSLRDWALENELDDCEYTHHGIDCLDAADELSRLTAENAKLGDCVLRAANVFRYYGKEVFGAYNFTDRHGDSEKCLRLCEYLLDALDRNNGSEVKT